MGVFLLIVQCDLQYKCPYISLTSNGHRRISRFYLCWSILFCCFITLNSHIDLSGLRPHSSCHPAFCEIECGNLQVHYVTLCHWNPHLSRAPGQIWGLVLSSPHFSMATCSETPTNIAFPPSCQKSSQRYSPVGWIVAKRCNMTPMERWTNCVCMPDVVVKYVTVEARSGKEASPGITDRWWKGEPGENTKKKWTRNGWLDYGTICHMLWCKIGILPLGHAG